MGLGGDPSLQKKELENEENTQENIVSNNNETRGKLTHNQRSFWNVS
jgi:hypothetical protein